MDTTRERAHWPGDEWPECWPAGKRPKPKHAAPADRTEFDAGVHAAIRAGGRATVRELCDVTGECETLMRGAIRRLVSTGRIREAGYRRPGGCARPAKAYEVAEAPRAPVVEKPRRALDVALDELAAGERSTRELADAVRCDRDRMGKVLAEAEDVGLVRRVRLEQRGAVRVQVWALAEARERAA